MATCDLCGVTAESASGSGNPGTAGDDLPLTWMTSWERGEQRSYCAACARENLRSVEAKLDAEWW